MLNNFWVLILMCATGWICIVLGSILKIPVIFQIILLTLGLVLSIISVIALIKLILGNKNT